GFVNAQKALNLHSDTANTLIKIKLRNLGRYSRTVIWNVICTTMLFLKYLVYCRVQQINT
ncbi:unnamed protein product, partial [Callosobruchus maculatus]